MAKLKNTTINTEIRVDNITNEAGTGAPEIVDHYKKSNILGTVSESDGVPTGAIFETGSNSDGDFIRFADGTQICTRSNIDFPSNEESEGVYTFDWTYPAAFSGRPFALNASGSNQNSPGRVVYNHGRYDNRVFSTEAQIVARVLFSYSNRAHRTTFFAIGRWY